MKSKKTALSVAVGTAFVATAALAPVANAVDNPFSQQKLAAGYRLAQADTKMEEGKCGGDKKAEAKCGSDKKMDAQGGASKKTAKKKDGKCGEGKCGGDKK